MSVETKHIPTVCERCNGRAYAAHDILGRFNGTWLHLYDEDWADNPHHVDPQPLDANALRLALLEQVP